jgi:hypothetical protein
MVVRHQDAVARDEVEQVGHLLKVRGYVRIVATEVSVVELNVDYMLDVAARGGEMATARSLRRSRWVESNNRQTAKKHCGERRDAAYASERMTPELPNMVHDPLSFLGPSILDGALLERRAGAVEALALNGLFWFHGDVICAHVWITAASWLAAR